MTPGMNSTLRCPVSGQSRVEEWVNTITHGVGFAGALVGFVVLLALAISYGSAWDLFNRCVYGLTLVALYGASTWYHACRCPTRKRALQKLDHCCIYLLIAGSYTPITLGPLYEHWGWALAIAVWSMAAGGILWRLFGPERISWVGAAPYLVMGWMAVIAIDPLINSLSGLALAWIIAGGAAYTLGVVFFVWTSLPFSHAIWHLFVLAGSACHYAGITFCLGDLG